ncbi:MAG: hypothetical protein ACYDEX_20480 [Mobilitalea sp.]
MNVKLILKLVMVFIVVVTVLTCIVELIERKQKKINNVSTSFYAKKNKKSLLYELYQRFIGFPLTSGYLGKISRRYEIISPGEPKTIAIKTMGLAITTILFCGAEITITYLIRPDIINFILAIYLIFVINNEVVNYYVSQAEILLLESMEVFITNVGHNYFKNQLIDDAIQDAITPDLSEEMRVHANKLYNIVISSDLKEDIVRYNTTMHNRYLKMFLSLCVGVMEYGDKETHGQKLFTANLMHLKKEINIEYLKIKKLRHVFAGSIFLAVSACLPISAIQQFNVSIVPELENFYSGQIGMVCVGLIFLSSVISYMLINNVKELKKPIPKNYRRLERLEKKRIIKKALDNYTDKHYGKMQVLRVALKRLGESITPRQLLLKRMIVATTTFVIGVGMVFYMHDSNRTLLTEKVSNIERMTTASNTQQIEMMREVLLRYVNKYIDDVELTEEQLVKELTNEGVIYNALLNQKIAKEIITRVNKSQSEYFKWYELLCCMAIALVSFFVPYLLIIFKKKVLPIIMEDEVNQFSSIIYMMMYSEHITVKNLLEQMELFAVVFRSSIQECMNDFNSGDIEALTRMRDREEYVPFKRLVNNLIRCDDMPICEAFDEIASDRENYYERRKLNNEISIDKSASNIKPLSFMPGILVGIYLVTPLVVTGVQQLSGLMELMESIGF